MVKPLDDIVLECTPLPVWICDRETHEILNVNESVIEKLRYPRSFWQQKRIDQILKGFTPVKFTVDQYVSVIDANGRTCSLGYETKAVEFGNISSLLVIAFPLQNSLTDRGRKLPGPRSYYNNIAEAVTDTSIVSVANADGVITYVNENFARISGYSPAQLIGQSHRLLNSGYHSQDFWRDVWREISSGKAWRGEVRNRARDGSFYWIDLSIVPCRSDDDVYEYVGISNDISRKKALENTSKRHAELLKRTLMFSATGIVTFEATTGRVSSSTQLLRLFDDPAGERRCSLDDFVDRYVIPEDRRVANDVIQQGLQVSADQPGDTKPVFRIQSRSGQVKNVMALGSFIYQKVRVIVLQVGDNHFNDDHLQTLTDRLALAAKAEQLGFWDYDVSKKQLIWDKAALQICGILGPESDGVSAWSNTVHPDDREQMLKNYVSAVSSGDVYTDEFRIVRQTDNVIRNIKSLGIIKRNPGGEPIRVVGVIVDITEQKVSEERLLRSETTYRSIVNDQFDLICRYNKEGTITFFNKSFQEAVVERRLTPEGRNFFALFPSSDQTSYAVLLHRLFETAKAAETTEGLTVSADRKRWWKWSHIPLKNASGEVYEVQAIGQEITKQRQLELQWRRLSKIVRESYNEIYLFDPSTLVFEFANDAALNNLGYTLEELVRMKLSDLFHYPNEMALHVLLKSLVSEGTDRLQLKLRHRRKDGSYYDVEIVLQVLENESSIVAIATDITQKLETEKKLLATIMEKEALIKEIHHRVKNNLQLISSIIYIKVNSVDESEIKYFLNDMRQKIHSIALIHERLLQSEVLDKVNVVEYLGKLISDLQSTNIRDDKKIEIVTDFDHVSIDIDSAIYCALIVNELITNAIKHAFNESPTGRIVVGFKRANGGFVLSVKDNGVTIPDYIKPGDSQSFGMHLLEVFVKQLRGKIEVVRKDGSSFNIFFNSVR